jgi:putative heme-binding domain-containing protein
LADVAGRIDERCRDADPIVRFQARLTCLVSGIRVKAGWEKTDPDDLWLRDSIVLSKKADTGATAFEYLWRTIASEKQASDGQLLLLEELAQVATASGSTGASLGLDELVQNVSAEVSLAALRGVAKVWARKNASDALEAAHVPVQRLIEIADDKKSSLKNRTSAVALLAFATAPAQRLISYAKTGHEQAIRISAINALGRQKGTEGWAHVVDGFASDTPPIRRAIIDGLLSNLDRTKLLLDAIEAGKIKPSEIDQLQVKRLTDNRDASIKDRAAKLFAAAMPADRAKALADYQPVLQIKGDPAKGQVVFEKNCAACHRINGIGVNVAPDISDSRAKKYEQILADILQPNRAIDNNYVGYTVRQLDGTILTGILAAETATSITLKQQGGKEAVIPRSEIDELKSSGQSLMPEGLERQIPPPDMADLLAFIKNWRYLDGRTPLSDSGQ